jgi:hypothetical protein
MTLVKPALPPVSPGQPVTAQGWNAVLGAVGALFDGVNAFGSNTVTVSLTADGQPITSGVVVAVPAAGAPVVAVPPFDVGTSFTLTQLTPGAWTLHAAAPGFAPATQAVTVPAGAPVTIALTTTTAAMPNLIGMTATAALAALASLGMVIDQILDIYGGDVNKVALPADRAGSKVLAQVPLPGTRVTGAIAAVKLVVSAPAAQAGPKAGDEKPPVSEKFDKSPSLDKHITDKAHDKRPELERIEKLIEVLPPAALDFAAPSGDLRVFIPPDERPPVGVTALAAPRIE